MLKLTRKTGETLIIGDDTEVTVLSVDGNQVKIGIDAPEDITILREELYRQVKEEEAA
ncbi:MAG: carbon storage regulator CsrA [Bacteroidetes bacterium]|nr:carbon storage regulator CsrA [Bacteroidota bacterium]